MNDKKPIIWIDGGIHARAWISVAFAMYFIKEVILHWKMFTLVINVYSIPEQCKV